MPHEALYISKGSARSLWQEYRIHPDRVELDTHLGVLAVPFEKIEGVAARPSDVRTLLRGDLQLRDFRPSLKLDWANFQPHVAIDKEGTFIRRVQLSPDNPEAFAAALKAAIDDWTQATR